MKRITPARLTVKDKIAIVSPCSFAPYRRYQRFISGIEKLGFEVCTAKNCFMEDPDYITDSKFRYQDFMEAVSDDSIKMILFGGGEIGNDFIDQLDYKLIRSHPKIYCSYSNGTSLLNAIMLNSNIETYYGQFPGVFDQITDYDLIQFNRNLLNSSNPAFFNQDPLKVLHSGIAEGILIGGYSEVMASMCTHSLFTYDSSQNYILILENKDRFASAATVLSQIVWITQSPFFKSVKGILFGSYSEQEDPLLVRGLSQIGNKYNIPIAMSDEFGHGSKHGILILGKEAVLDLEKKKLFYK